MVYTVHISDQYMFIYIYIFWIHFALSMSIVLGQMWARKHWRWIGAVLAHASDDKPPHQNSRKVC